ncbi:MAG: fibronectin type III domain-containing protein [Treponema sp.]|nr:fibronectin type III domain-containing protein [Treponema sp.]
MKKILLAIAALYCFLLPVDRAFGIGERTITIGNASSWQAMERRLGIAEAPLVRPNPVLVLSGYAASDPSLDLRLSFNEGAPANFLDSRWRYDVSASPDLRVAPVPWNRTGTGAALFSGTTGITGQAPLEMRPRPHALFAPGNYIQDFSIEFWVFPQVIENGAQIATWTSYLPDGQGDFLFQRIQAIVTRNRLEWTFQNFFSAPGGSPHLSVRLEGSPLIPRAWSHHLIRFDADIGIVEYWVDGVLEAVAYATSTGREGGEVFTPIAGEEGRWTLGMHFSGMIDVFHIHNRLVEIPQLTRLPSRGGRVESGTLDLGRLNSRLLRIEAFGGRTTNTAGRTVNRYTGNAPLRFGDHAEINFFARASNELFAWNNSPWIPIAPGAPLPDTFRGRFVQIAADFYPSADGQTSPFLSEIRLVYQPAEPPPAPTNLVAVARNGAVELSWRASASRDVGGYFVFFGTSPGEYFGYHVIVDGMILSSPIDVGNRTSVRIEGLSNGTLYFFAVAAYGDTPIITANGVFPEVGAFSREVAARPLQLPSEDNS